MGLRGAALVLILLAVTVPAVAPARDGLECQAAGAPLRAAQSDAGLPGDAPDDGRTFRPLRMDPPTDGHQGEYYWGWLDPPATRLGADHDDHYVARLSEGAKTVMLELTSNYTMAGAEDDLTYFRVDVWRGPVDAEPDHVLRVRDAVSWTATDAETIHLRVRVEAFPVAPTCDAAPILPGVTDAPAQRNHGVYLGCDPFCVETSTG